jgi:DNA primase
MAITDLPIDPITRSERDALMALIQHPEAVGRTLTERVLAARFTNPTLAVIRDAVASSLEDFEGSGWIDRINREVPEAFRSLVSQLAVAPILSRSDRLIEYCEKVVADLVDRDILREKAELVGAMQRASADGDTDRWTELSRRSVALETERRQLRKE